VTMALVSVDLATGDGTASSGVGETVLSLYSSSESCLLRTKMLISVFATSFSWVGRSARAILSNSF